MEGHDEKGIIVESKSTFESMMDHWKQANELEDVNLDLGMASKAWFFDRLKSINAELVKKIKIEIFTRLEQ